MAAEQKEIRLRIPAPPVPPEYERVPPEVLKVVLNYKLMKAMREAAERLEGVEKRLAAIERVTAPLKTTVTRLKQVQIPKLLIDLKGRGHLKAFMIKSGRSDFRVRLYADGLELYNNDYSWFEAVSQEVAEIAAFESDGLYVLSISDVKFAKSFKLIVEPVFMAKPFKIDEVYWKLDIAASV